MTPREALQAAHPDAVVIGDDHYAALSDGLTTLMHHDGEFIAVCYRPTIDATATGRTPDEALAKLDQLVRLPEGKQALAALMQGRTTIAIAHRLSTLHRANRLVVLDRGQVVEVGSHDDLMAREGAYFNLYQAQARNMDVDMDDDRRRYARVNTEKDDK